MKKFLQFFANLKLAIFLLLLIAFFSGLGSVIEQDKALEFYIKNYKSLVFGAPIWMYIKALQLDQIYGNWWFFLLLFIFGFCLLSCTFTQQFPALKFARRYYFYTYANQFNKLKYKFTVETVLKGQLCYRLILDQYSIFQKQACFYGYKGLIGRIGPVIVHISIICILLGSVLGALKGFNAQEFVPKSETFHTQNIVKSGSLAIVPQQAFRINDFWVNYNQKGLIKQFQSDISILDGKGEELLRKTISVNNPLVYKNLTLYQTDWGITGIRIQLPNRSSIIQLPISKISDSSQKLWVSWFPINNNEKKGVIIVLNNARGKVDFYNERAQFMKTVSIGQTIFLTDILPINLVEFISSTGIQIKADSGIKIIYIGFAFLIISSFVSYISFSEIWFLEAVKVKFFGGQTNRAKVKFQLEILKLKKLYSR